MNLIGRNRVKVESAMEWARSKNATEIFIKNAEYYWRYCARTGVNPVIAYCQYALETGWGRFGGVIDASYCNPCGLKVTVGGGDKAATAHKRFSSWEEGVTAHIDHLALYAGAPGFPKPNSPDPRHFPYLKGSATTVESLQGKWATDPKYFLKLNSLISELIKYGKENY